jgi:hypothetical protein
MCAIRLNWLADRLGFHGTGLPIEKNTCFADQAYIGVGTVPVGEWQGNSGHLKIQIPSQGKCGLPAWINEVRFFPVTGYEIIF